MMPYVIPLMILLGAMVGVLVGLIAGVLRQKGGLLLAGSASVAVGLVLALTWQELRPLQFDRMFTFEAWLEWWDLMPSPFVLMIIPRSLILPAIGFAVAVSYFVFKDKARVKVALVPVALFLVTIAGTWAMRAEHLPSGVTSDVYVYRIDDPTSDPQVREAWSKQSDQWLEYLDWNFANGFGYESYMPDWVDSPRMVEHLGGPVAKLKPGEAAFVVIKVYRKGDEYIASTREVLYGFQTAEQLRAAAKQVATRRLPLN